MDRKELIRTLRRLFWVVLVFGAAAIVISAVERKENSPAARLDIRVEPLPDGHNLITPEDIQLSIERSFGFSLVGAPLGKIDVKRLEKVLEEDPFIRESDVFVDAQNQIHIEVEQRRPLLRVIDNNGLNYYLDESGHKMPLSKHFTARVLVATGNIPPHVPDFLKRDRHRLQDLYHLAHRLRDDPFFAALIEQVHVNNRGELTLAPKVGDQKIRFGYYENVEDKLENLKIFYKEALPYEGWQKYAAISVQYRGQVVAQKK